MCTACSCTTDTTTETGAERTTTPPAEISEFMVTGMTCGHCVGSVTEQIQLIDGVRDVSVDLATGAVTVTADQAVSADDVSVAVREAGYQIA